MTILWQPTAAQLAAKITALGAASPGACALGQTLLGALGTDHFGTGAGPVYDSAGNDGGGSQGHPTPYQLSFSQWWSYAPMAAWAELDRLGRYAYSLAFLPTSTRPPTISDALTAQARGAFGLPGAVGGPGTSIAWTSATNYGPGGLISALVSPAPSNGFYYLGTINGGTSASSQPVWPTTLLSTVADGSQLWQCVIAVTPVVAGTPATLGPDASLQSVTALQLRYAAAVQLAPQLGQIGLGAVLSAANTAWIAALAARPAPNVGLDAASTAAINSLNTALANANSWLAAASFT